ncbi:Pre-rRNA-processing protein tsr2 [Schizosaccharomyces pombe]
MFDDPSKRLTYFEYAVGVLLCSWPVMKQAVEEEWADVDTADKRDWMAGVLVDYITVTNDVEAWDVEELILQVLQDEFNVGSIEDDSPYILAQDLVNVWKAACEDNYEPIREIHERLGKQLLEKEEGKEKTREESNPPVLVEDETIVDAEDGGAAQNQQEKQQGPIVDDDGFTVVQKRRR